MKGLVVGKFAPLHLGHELVIQRALAECAELVLISYCDPEPAGCAAERRSAWLVARFPQARRIVGDPARWPEMPRDADGDAAQRAFVRKLLQGEGLGIDVVYTSEEYGAGLANPRGRPRAAAVARARGLRERGSKRSSRSRAGGSSASHEGARRHLRGLGGT